VTKNWLACKPKLLRFKQPSPLTRKPSRHLCPYWVEAIQSSSLDLIGQWCWKDRHHAGVRQRAKATAQAPELVQQLGAPGPVAGHMGVALWANALAGDAGLHETRGDSLKAVDKTD
jgi:hypothetical protein